MSRRQDTHSLDDTNGRADPTRSQSPPRGFTEEQQRLLEQLLAAEGISPDDAPPPIRRRRETEELSLSFAQQRLWLLDQLQPGSPAYNIPKFLRLRGHLDVSALAQSLDEVIRRHEALRTTFESRHGSPLQRVNPAVHVPLPVTDLSHLSPAEREAEATRLLAGEVRRPFDLAVGPLMRASLVKLSDEEHALGLVLHHIISDGWSLGVLLRELSAFYSARLEGRSPTLPDLPIQYADYALWQRSWLRGEALDRRLAYWRDRLSGAPEVLSLPADRPRPAAAGWAGDAVRFDVAVEVADALRREARRRGVTLFMLLLSAFKVLLWRHSGEADISVGTPAAGRDRVEVEGLIGFFVNTLVLRTKVEGKESFSGLVARVREACLGAYQHQEVPFEKLVEELALGRSLAHAPLYQVAFLFVNAPESYPLPGIETTSFQTNPGTAKVDLTLAVTDMSDRLLCILEYNTDLFDTLTAERLSSHFVTLLREIAADMDKPVGDLRVLPEGERRRLLRDFNDTSRSYPGDLSIHQLFARQARNAPASVALEGEGGRLTYAELDSRSNQLAQHLQRLGVGPESRVAVMLKRSPELVVALLAVLKAGGAYVPLDPEYPRERLAFMLEDSGAHVLVTDSALSGLAGDADVRTVRLDAEREQLEIERDEAPRATVSPDNLAYVMYTSGSTGRPKGVAVTHRNVVRLVFGQTYAEFGPGEVFLLLAPVCFDASTFELWGALLHGARLALMGAEAPSLDDLAQALERHGVTTLWLTAGLFQQMVEHKVEGIKGVRQLLTGGDIVSPAHAARFLRECGGRLINGYGPTEATTFTCCHPITEAEAAAGPVPIGRPVANARVYILDGGMRPVPLGARGELYIGGDGLARGYANSPALTAERFVPDPFSSEPGARLYRTGDICRYLPDGRVEFGGRRDAQVKLRGFRIELGEIEAAIAAHPSVREAAVLVRAEEPGGERFLVCYAVPRSPRATDAGELRGYLAGRLPEYMLPQRYVFLPELPLTANGKVDRDALPAPDDTSLARRGVYEEPREGLETALAHIWGDVLEVERVGANDNFFELGGHSLLAMQVVSRVRELLHVELPLRAFFEAPTLNALASVISYIGNRQSERKT